jgi:hypothetical protein
LLFSLQEQETSTYDTQWEIIISVNM